MSRQNERMTGSCHGTTFRIGGALGKKVVESERGVSALSKCLQQAREAMRKLITLGGCLLLVISEGCCFFPLPTERTLEMRYEITSNQAAFITPGITHREEVIHELGQPYVEFPDLRIMAYTWVMRVGRVSGCVVLPYELPWAGDIRYLYRYYTLLIVFDSAERVVKFEQLSSWDYYENVREKALKWVKTQGLAVPKVSPMLAGKMIPPGESAIYIYWEPGFWNYPPFGGWEVEVDGKIIGWLRKRQYLGIVLAPGTHRVTVKVYFIWEVKNLTSADTSIHLEALPGQVHYVSVRQTVREPGTPTMPYSVLTERSEGEALPALKKMKPMP